MNGIALKGADVRLGNFTSICTHFTYQDILKYAIICQDRVLRENLENP